MIFFNINQFLTQQQNKNQLQHRMYNSQKSNQRKLGINQLQTQPTQYDYNSLSKSSLIQKLKCKNIYVTQFKNLIQTWKVEQNQQIERYRKSLEEQIKHTQEAVYYFGRIIQKIKQITSKLNYPQINYGSIAKNKTSKEKQQQKSLKQSQMDKKQNVDKMEQEQQQECDNLANIFNELNIYLDNLAMLVDSANHHTKNLYEQIKLQQIEQEKLLKQKVPKKKQHQQELKQLESTIQSLILQKQNFRILLNKNEQEKTILIKSISTILSDQVIEEFQKLSKSELIYNIKKLTFRVRQLQIEKKNILNANKLERKKDQQKFQLLLQEVKGIQQQKKNQKKKL